MRAEGWHKEEIKLEGWPVTLISYRIGDSFVTAVESTDSGATIARCTGATREAAQQQALETATRRVLRTRRFDPGLTVGG